MLENTNNFPQCCYSIFRLSVRFCEYVNTLLVPWSHHNHWEHSTSSVHFICFLSRILRITFLWFPYVAAHMSPQVSNQPNKNRRIHARDQIALTITIIFHRKHIVSHCTKFTLNDWNKKKTLAAHSLFSICPFYSFQKRKKWKKSIGSKEWKIKQGVATSYIVYACPAIGSMWQFPRNVDSTPNVLFQQTCFFSRCVRLCRILIEWVIEILMCIWIISCNGFKLLRDSRIFAWLALLSLVCTVYTI